MAINDFYKLETIYSYLNGVVMNRYFYRQQAGSNTDAQYPALAWLEDVYPAIKAVQSDQMVLLQLRCINLNNPIDFHEESVVGAAGDLTGDPMPPFVAWRFKLNRESREFRPGRKAIGGVTETSVTAGVAAATILPDLEDVADALAANINYTAAPGNVFTPYLVRELGMLPPLEFTPVTGAAYVEVSSQNTRKFNRGI